MAVLQLCYFYHNIEQMYAIEVSAAPVFFDQAFLPTSPIASPPLWLPLSVLFDQASSFDLSDCFPSAQVYSIQFSQPALVVNINP